MISELIKRLQTSIIDDDFLDVCDDVVESLEVMDDNHLAIKPILLLMETYPDADFGQPGPLVHFIEQFFNQGYESELVQSLVRKPTMHTVWLLNRIMNGSELIEKRYYMSILDSILLDPQALIDVKVAANAFRTIHEDL